SLIIDLAPSGAVPPPKRAPYDYRRPAGLPRAGHREDQLRAVPDLGRAQSVRNALEPFHGSRAFDPDNPASGEGFISDDQMRVLNIAIRRATHEALSQVDIAHRAVLQSHLRELRTEEREALDFCGFQLRTIGAYMESPGSPELEKAYQRYISEPDVNR
ncbi:MAG TPA: hypothetical protein VGL33_26545, partial [Streptosporangiaceae bacterium]